MCDSLKPVRMLISISGNSTFSAAIIDSPSSPGMQISEKRMSGFSLRVTSNPSFPLQAVAAIRQLYFSHGRSLDNPSTMIGSSSIITTLYIKNPPFFPFPIIAQKGTPPVISGCSFLCNTLYFIFQLSVFYHPLTAPAVIPLMIYFCKKIYTIMTGITTSETVDAISP